MSIASNQSDNEENNVGNERISLELIEERIGAHLEPHTVAQSTD